MAEVIITLADDCDVAAVAAALKTHGLQGGTALSELRVVTGKAGDDALPALRNVPGVVAVEPGGPVGIPEGEV